MTPKPTLIASGGFLQTHHIKALQWLRDGEQSPQERAELQTECMGIARRSYRSGCPLFQILTAWAVQGRKFKPDDATMGMIREGLNAADRIRRRQIKALAA